MPLPLESCALLLLAGVQGAMGTKTTSKEFKLYLLGYHLSVEVLNPFLNIVLKIERIATDKIDIFVLQWR